MSCTRRQFITRVGALAAVSGMAGRVVANTLNINGVRYGMVHDESLCIGCTACMDACREVNTVPEGVSRLTRLPVLHCRVSLPRALYPSGQ